MIVNEKMSEVSNHYHRLAGFQCCGRQYSDAIPSLVDCMQIARVPWNPIKVPSPRNHSMCDTLDRKAPQAWSSKNKHKKEQSRHGMQVETYSALAKARAAKTTCLKAFESRLGIERTIGPFLSGQWQR